MNFTPEDNLRFGLGLLHDKRPIDECVLEYVQHLEHLLQKERKHYKQIIDDLRKKQSGLDSAYIDHLYNQQIVEQAWKMIGNHNRHCLELPEAIREKIRDLVWEVEESRKKDENKSNTGNV